MKFEWNEEKRQSTITDRGVDFLYAALIFEGPTLTRTDDRADYGEVRQISLGLIDDTPYVVIHTKRGENIRLIAAWKGGRRDYEKYKDSFP
ncbi:BrnT family toxin [Pseudosulfitobacter sp. SM2401]|uniref:BrnT family toxin n=1 Tax=Pseudosulfitobacter sp. SM2401 TaxID=3350098 RepID=UPI0036F3FC8D